MRVQCPTCLEVFTLEDELQCPPCGHVFHRACIQQWLRSKRGSDTGPDCPQCRKPTNMKSPVKIYLAEADGGDTLALEERRKNLKNIEEIHETLEIKEGENNSLSDRIAKLERNLKEKSKEFNKIKVTRLVLKKFESEREENEKFKDKWLKCKTMLQELEKKQKPLKMKLRETEIQRKKEETRKNVAEKEWKDAEKRLEDLRAKIIKIDLSRE